jgi:hypothetical protein
MLGEFGRALSQGARFPHAAAHNSYAAKHRRGSTTSDARPITATASTMPNVLLLILCVLAGLHVSEYGWLCAAQSDLDVVASSRFEACSQGDIISCGQKMVVALTVRVGVRSGWVLWRRLGACTACRDGSGTARPPRHCPPADLAVLAPRRAMQQSTLRGASWGSQPQS